MLYYNFITIQVTSSRDPNSTALFAMDSAGSEEFNRRDFNSSSGTLLAPSEQIRIDLVIVRSKDNI